MAKNYVNVNGKWVEMPMRVEFDKDARVLWLPRSDKDLEALLDSKYERVTGHLQWRAPEDGTWTLEKLWSFAGALMSGLLPVDDPIIQLRRKSCFGDGQQKPCSALQTTGDGSWCAACGCGKTKLAELDGSFVPKLRYRNLNCPLMRPGFSNAQ